MPQVKRTPLKERRRRVAAASAPTRSRASAVSNEPAHIQRLERERVARELHDGVNQLLVSTKHRLRLIEPHVSDRPDVQKRLSETQRLLDRALAEIRSIASDGRPRELDEHGLIGALRNVAAEFTSRTGVTVDCELCELRAPLRPQVELTIYRIVQESLNNVEKHANARRVLLEFSARDLSAWLRVVDDGDGFVPQSVNGVHQGLTNMRQRAESVQGTFKLRSRPRGGTEVEIKIPL